MQLELLKPELIQREENIESTIVMFGGARILPADAAQAKLDEAQSLPAGAARDHALRSPSVRWTWPAITKSAAFASMVTNHSAQLQSPIYVVTGGGPGIMEAGNRGAFDVGGKALASTSCCRTSKSPTPITPKLCFQFHYFALRKMHFLMRSVALVAFPGGFGTLDELFEALT